MSTKSGTAISFSGFYLVLPEKSGINMNAQKIVQIFVCKKFWKPSMLFFYFAVVLWKLILNEKMSVMFVKSPSSRRGPVKVLTWGSYAEYLAFFFFFRPSRFALQRLCLWPLEAHQASVKRQFLQLSSQTAMIELQGRQKIESACWSAMRANNPEFLSFFFL